MVTLSRQHPLPSGFGAKTTAREVIGERRLDGTTAIVTGGYAGIGLETTRVLAAAGADVIVPARDIAKATAALSGLSNVTIEALDLGLPSTIDAFANRFGDRPLHLLVNNAGIMAVPLSRDARGLESQLAVNHVGHFHLFTRLLPALRRANGARVVALSSRGHVRSAFDFEDPNFEHRPYDKMVAYGQSKTANVLFAVEADRRYEREGIRAFAVHPGAILGTDLVRNYDPEELKAVTERAKRIGSFKTVEQGAATTIWCATSAKLAGLGGVYCENCDVALVKSEGDDGVRPYAVDPANAERLWAWSERATSGSS
jgi:NAD(P)-dependent dehydrogenase (short-subunit alcohol dehydrogenase family)